MAVRRFGRRATLVQYVADDGFYYLQLARNWTQMGRWTFDGVEPATGFHLLYAYLLAGMSWLQGGAYSWRTSVVAMSGLGAMAMIGSAAVLHAALWRRFGAGVSTGALALFLSPVVLEQPTMGLESPFVIVTASALVYVILTPMGRNKRSALLVAFGVGDLSPAFSSSLR